MADMVAPSRKFGLAKPMKTIAEPFRGTNAFCIRIRKISQ